MGWLRKRNSMQEERPVEAFGALNSDDDHAYNNNCFSWMLGGWAGLENGATRLVG